MKRRQAFELIVTAGAATLWSACSRGADQGPMTDRSASPSAPRMPVITGFTYGSFTKRSVQLG